MVALEGLGLGQRARLRFICEKDAAARRLICAHRSPEHIFNDIMQRSVDDMPVCDIYVAGFPCQPWSTAGLRQGTADKHGRGNIFPRILDYLHRKRPKCFLLENVKGLTTSTHQECFASMLDDLKRGNLFIVTWRVLNTADFGIPQNRPRLYIIGFLRDAVPGGMEGSLNFKWPRGGRHDPLQSLLQGSEICRPQVEPGTIADRNLQVMLHKLKQQGVDPALEQIGRAHV